MLLTVFAYNLLYKSNAARRLYPWDDRKESYSAQKTKDDSDKKVIPT